MTKKTVIDGYHVEVSPWTYYNQSVEGQRADCETAAVEIRRHVDNLPRTGDKGVSVVAEEHAECSYCGAKWTESTDVWNGGCCANDADFDPEANTP